MRLIDADALMGYRFKNPISYNAFVNLIKRMPAAEVVRCKDCIHRIYVHALEHYPETYICRCDDLFGTRKAYDDNWFCADGERRTDDNDN